MRKTVIQYLLISMLMLTGLAVVQSALAAEDDQDPDLRALARNTEQLKQQAVDFNRDLLLLEDAAVPGERRVIVFVSQSRELPMTLESAEIQIDPGVNIRRRYTAAESAALRKGGSQRLYMGASASGRHVLSASLLTHDSNGDTRRYSSKLSFRVGQAPKTLELQLDGQNPAEAALLIHESN